MRLKHSPLIVLCTALAGAVPLEAQQKGQYLPGQFGLNAGILPSPGFTYTNMEINYDTDMLNNPSGNAVPPKPIGYDQWQITVNGGTFAVTGPQGNTLILPTSTLPFYSVHAAGGQATFIMPEKNLALFLKYEHEFVSYSHTLGNTLVFGGSGQYAYLNPPPPKNERNGLNERRNT